MFQNQQGNSKAIRKFVRSTNFSIKEENILLATIKKYSNEIECKSTDSNMRNIKKNAWMKVTREFNMASGETARDEVTSKNKYENINKRSKEKFANYKNYITGTGGRDPKDICITNTDNTILEIIGTQMTGHTSEFDDDVVEEYVVLSEHEIVENEEISETSQSHSDSQWLAGNAAHLLKTPKSHFLNASGSATVDQLTSSPSMKMAVNLPMKIGSSGITPKKNNETVIKTPFKKNKKNTGFGYRAEEWARCKCVLAELQKQGYIDEQKMKLQHMQEKHDKELSLLERDAEEKRKLAYEQHLEKMELLRMEKAVLQKKLSA